MPTIDPLIPGPVPSRDLSSICQFPLFTKANIGVYNDDEAEEWVKKAAAVVTVSRCCCLFFIHMLLPTLRDIVSKGHRPPF
ncbi:hypothetical protein JTE90_007738 [Oedothorax gibbosus]|uniref:Uncharacterized protein n=1 Tax=Oedothorax gibbosus TaxID=931172 RepID=A0AAV6V6Y9_9ARAC|nr:hypothetical protein JTE90_007738 [Oedothorax gibbosus]